MKENGRKGDEFEREGERIDLMIIWLNIEIFLNFFKWGVE
jgi:hypothetical protein